MNSLYRDFCYKRLRYNAIPLYQCIYQRYGQRGMLGEECGPSEKKNDFPSKQLPPVCGFLDLDDSFNLY